MSEPPKALHVPLALGRDRRGRDPRGPAVSGRTVKLTQWRLGEGPKGEGQRARHGAHLEFLLGHEVLHAPDDLDGGPVVLPQPAWGQRGACLWPPLEGKLGAFPSAPCARGPGPSGSKEAGPPPLGWRSSRPRPGGGGAVRGGQEAFIRRMIPEGPLPLRGGVRIGVPCLTEEPQKLLFLSGLWDPHQ